MNRTIVHSFAKQLGERCVHNDELVKFMDTSDEWITQRSGIKTRYWANPETQTSDLSVAAAKQTLAAAGNPKIDAIVAATLSPDYYFPGIGVLVQNKLGLSTVPAYDIREQCSGFLYGLEMSQALIAAGKYSRILFVCAEIHSRGLDLSTRGRDLAVLFGDGAGSCIVESAAEKPSSVKPSGVKPSGVKPISVKPSSEKLGNAISFEVLDTELHSDGSGHSDLWCELPGSVAYASQLTPEMLDAGRAFAKMNGRKVFENAVKRMTEVSLSVLGKVGLSPKDLTLIVPHQANQRINTMVAKELGLSESQVFNTIQKYGNTTSATIPIGMCDAVAAGAIKSGDYILQSAFGSGFTWGAAVLRAI